MRSPGFVVHNETLWPVEVSLEQVGPLYWGVVPPGGVFSRGTGAVWFTIRGRVSLDGKGRITMGDAVWPIAAIVGEIALAALVTVVTFGAGTGEVIAGELAAEAGAEAALETTEVVSATIGEAVGEAELAMPAMTSAVLPAATVSPVSGGIAGAVMSAAGGAAAAAGDAALAASGGGSQARSGVATSSGLGAVLTEALARSGVGTEGITVDDVYVGGRSLPELIAAGDAEMALAGVFTKANSSASESGCYAGPDWPFRRRVHEYVLSGGPTLVARPGGGVDLVPQALHLR